MRTLAQSASESILENGHKALHYSGGLGPAKVRQWIKEQVEKSKIFVEATQIYPTFGAMQGIDLTTRVLINPGDEVWVEGPTFFNGLQSFRLAGAQIKTFPLDEEGVQVDILEQSLKDAKGKNQPIPKFFYCMPNFHNPAGVTLSIERRKKLAALAYEYNFYILEDNAYGDLSFTHEYLPSIYSFAPKRVIYLGTFSKIIAPGLRLGWMIANEEVLQKVHTLALGSQTSPFTQEIVTALLEKISYKDHLKNLIDTYRSKQDAMVNSIQKYFGDEVHFIVPEGGFFLLLNFKPEVDTAKFVQQAFENGVSVIEGRSFYVNGEGKNQIRLCFSYCDEQQIDRGIKILAEAYFASIKGQRFIKTKLNSSY
ncbi:aminotransferase-like domain-containing protein [Niallia sp. 03190]|uniref:aminotransferase-like domain-containing protein n=1 Tax=Niallia sp. 03190 TaxID=3458061 RepID=UPI0040447890